MNHQTPGPAKAVSNRPEETDKLDRIKMPDGHNIAFIPDLELPYREEQANAKLLAASYTAFDKAGREMGVEAFKLAESINISGMISALELCVKALKDHLQYDDGESLERDAHDAASATLKDLYARK